jgi:hypothetical protein
LIANGNVTTTAGNSWIASWDKGSGTITVTSMTSDRIVGTFEFSAPLSIGSGPPATMFVTSGAFDLPLTN